MGNYHFYDFGDKFKTHVNSVSNKVAEKLLVKLDNSQLSPGNKTALTNFLNRNEGVLSFAIEEAFTDILKLFRDSANSANKALHEENGILMRIDGLKEEREALSAEVEKLKKEREELGNKYSNPNAREAIMLWNEIMEPYRNAESQMERNAILSAGKVVSAVFGGVMDKETLSQNNREETK